MMARLRDDTDTALVRYFRPRRRLFTWLIRATVAMTILAFAQGYVRAAIG